MDNCLGIKKLFVFVLMCVVILLCVGCSTSSLKEKEVKHKYSDLLEDIEVSNTIDVTQYTIYGKHFNLKSDTIELVNSSDNIRLVLKSIDTELEYQTFLFDDVIITNRYINRGILLDDIPIGDYLVLLKVINSDVSTYYNLVNKSEYDELEYYTMTRDYRNNKIIIDNDTYKDYSYMYLEVKEEKLPDNVYDIVIDPGHGGVDSGAVNGKYKEDTLNLEYGLMIKDALTDLGLKVKMTREEDVSLKTYGHGSRTAIPYEVKAKLMLSIHLNSTNSYVKNGGIEVYTASGDDLYFAKDVAKNIVEHTSSDYSPNAYNRIEKGVYTRVYSEKDIKDSIKTAVAEGWVPYEFKDDTTYYYFIRETGGIMTKAFADGRNPKYEANPYYNSNYGVEAYLIELGYISNSKNLKILLNEKESYVKAIKESVLNYLNNNF